MNTNDNNNNKIYTTTTGSSVNNELEMNDSLTIRLNGNDKKYFNDMKDAQGTNAGLLIHKILEDFKKNNISDTELNLKVDFAELNKSLRALEGVFNAVVNKSHTFVINNKTAADIKIAKAEEDLKSVRELYSEKEDKLTTRVNGLLNEKDMLLKQLQEVEQKLKEHDSTIHDLNREVEEYRDDIDTLKLEKKTALDTIDDKNEIIKNLRIIETDCIRVKAELEEYKNKVSVLDGENAKLTSSINDLSNINSELNETLSKQNTELTELSQQYKELDTQFVALDRANAKTNDKLEELSATLADTKNSNKELSSELSAKSSEIIKLEQDKINSIATVTKEKNDLSTELHNQINTLKTEHSNKMNTLLAESEIFKKSADDCIATITKERDNLLSENNDLKKKISKLETKLLKEK